MDTKQIVELTRRSINDQSAWEEIMAAVGKINDLPTLLKLRDAAHEPQDEDGTLGLASVMYIAERMVNIFVPFVLKCETDEDQELLLGLFVKYFSHRISAAHIASKLEKVERHQDRKTAIMLHVLAIAYAIGASGPEDWESYLIYLDGKKDPFEK